MKLPLEGGCLCGEVRYRISVEPRGADYCHCRMCQRASGAFAWARGEPAVYRSSQTAERLFCRSCGTQLVFREIAALDDHLDVTLASLDDPEAVRPSHHIWTSSRIGWFETADDLPRYPERGPDVSS